MPLTAGTRLGPYEVGALIRSGSMGEVYVARDPRLRRSVALKVLPPSTDRSSFLVNTRQAGTSVPPLRVMMNWHARAGH